jgi:Zn-dependent protease
MAWQDRPYYRDRSDSTGNPLTWLMTGSVPLFTVFGIRVRMHAMLVLTIVLVLLFGLGQGFTWQDRVQSMAVLFTIVLLHEFGHCFAARVVGGTAEDIVMHPLGGLALASAPRRPWPQFVTVAGGPAVNVVICLICGLLLWFKFGWLPWNPTRFVPINLYFDSWFNLWRYAIWIYQVSWMLLVFNLLPIYPLDGGQLLQVVLWPKFGYFKSMLFATMTGMIGAVLMTAVGVAAGGFFLIILGVGCFVTCLAMRRQVLAEGPYAFEDEPDYSAAYDTGMPKPKRTSKRAVKRAAKRIAAERDERERIDAILAKVSAQGMNSLTWLEKRALKKATEHQRQNELAMKRRGF